MTRVLIVDDDQTMAQMLHLYLEDEGYKTDVASDGDSALKALKTFEPDVIILDLYLPDKKGNELIDDIQNQTEAPIIMISLETKSSERIHALKRGVDDFLSKPFNMKELQARIEVVLRRVAKVERANLLKPEPKIEQLHNKKIELDRQKRVLTINTEQVELTNTEFELLSLFTDHPGIVFSREDLINRVKGNHYFLTDRSIDVHITNLRKKIEDHPKQPEYIKTVWGIGYKWMN
ncbi:response regulator transcription factor [Metabacillus endolithicus]|uniref:Response regulator transcription factor n=1 Tax=Metabacillus endolithicus TaxID=1535204 RepID=A0ABW5C0C4_9BACI